MSTGHPASPIEELDRYSPSLREGRDIRAGVPQDAVMKLCSWKTDAMFRRYAITDERDLHEAVAMLARGTTGGQAAISAGR